MRDSGAPDRQVRRPLLVPLLLGAASVACAFLLSIPLSAAAATALGVPRSALASGGPLGADAFLVFGLGMDVSLLATSALLFAALGGGPLPLRPRRSWVGASLAAAVAVVGLNLAGSLGIAWLGESYVGLPDAASSVERIALGALGCGLAPFAEELFFREVLLVRLFPEDRRGLGVAFSSLAFGFLHISSGGPILVLTLVLMGIVLAALRARSASLGPPIAVHAANNAVAFALAWIAPEGA